MVIHNPGGEQLVTSINTAVHPATLVIGLGNPILGDDGIGWRVIEELANRLTKRQGSPLDQVAFPLHLSDPDVELDCLAVGGLTLMERVIGYERVVIIDSMVTNQNPIGTTKCYSVFDLEKLDTCSGHLTSSHDTSFTNALRVGKEMGAKLPEHITILGIEIKPSFDFSEELSSEVISSINQACELFMELIK
jgi:hydrogenase maturation protease